MVVDKINVIKGDGRSEKLDISKIQKMTQQACEGLHGVSASQVEMNCGIQFFDGGIETSDIQKILVKSASDLISLEAPNYEYVAARLLLYGLRKNVFHEFDYPILLDHVKHNIDRGVYDKDLLTYYDDAEWDKLNKMIDHNRDENFTYAGLQQVVDKYLVQDRSSGDVYETPQFMYILIAATLFAQYPKQTRLQYVKRYYNAISTFKINIPTPVMAGVRTPIRQFASCVLVDVDDTLNSIFNSDSAIGYYVSQRAGIGINAGRIRESMQKLGAEKYNILVLFLSSKSSKQLYDAVHRMASEVVQQLHTFLSGIKKSTTSLYSKITKGQKTTE